MENYPYRIPEKYPKKGLHERVRMLLMSYHDFARFQKFWVDLFGWDMFELPEAAGGKILKGKYEVDGELYAVLEDSEGNPFYIWQTPSTAIFLKKDFSYTRGESCIEF